MKHAALACLVFAAALASTVHAQTPAAPSVEGRTIEGVIVHEPESAAPG